MSVRGYQHRVADAHVQLHTHTEYHRCTYQTSRIQAAGLQGQARRLTVKTALHICSQDCKAQKVSPCLELPTTMLPSRVRMSARSVVRASTAMISDATAMSNPVFLVMPFSVLDSPTVISRRKRSFTSSTRLQVMVLGSKSSRANLQGMLMLCAASVLCVSTPKQPSQVA